MSSSSSLTNCCICLERMKQPIKTLPCLHSSCSTCIDGLIKMGQKPFKCPLCRAPFEAPAAGAKGAYTLPPNYFIYHLLSSGSPHPGGNEQDGFDPNDIKCEICEENDAEEYCKDCEQFFCLGCKKRHLKTKMSTQHKFVSLEDGLEIKQGGGPSSSASASASTRTTRCHKHPQQEVNSYCEQCKEACCSECSVDNHSGHRVVRLSTMAEKFKGDISTSMEKVKHFDDQLSKAIKEIADTLLELQKQAKISEEHVYQLFEKLRLLLAEREAELLGEIETKRHQKEKELFIQKEELEFLLTGVRDSLSFGEKLVSEGSGVEIAASHKPVTGRFETLVNEMKKTPLSPATDGVIELVGGEQGVGDATKVIKQIGMIVANDISSEKSKVVFITNRESWKVNEEYSFEVHLVDKKGEKVSKLSPTVTPFQVNLAGPSKMNVEIKGGNEGGIRKVSMRPNQIGNHDVSVLMKGKHLQGSPFKLNVVDKEIVRMVYRRDYARVNDQPVVRFGSNGQRDGQFQNPYSVACNTKGEIIVADGNNHRIQVFDKDGKFLIKFGSKGNENGQFNAPEGVTVDHRNDNQIVVADNGNNRIQIFDERGRFLRSFGSQGNGDGQFSYPRGVVVDQTNGNYFVTDYSNHRVQVFNSEGNFIRKFGLNGNGNGQLIRPWGIGLLSNGNVVVSEHNNNRLQIFTPEGEFVRVIGAGQVSYPTHLFVDSEDNILVASFSNHRIQVFNQNGDHVKSIGSGQLSGPFGVSMDPEGRIVVSEKDAHRISIF